MIRIRKGLLVDPASGRNGKFDMLVEKGRISAVDVPGSFDTVEVAEDIEAQGKWVVPGLVDLHVHLREPGLEWKETIATGAEAAIRGGYTSICCMPNTKPSNHSAEITEYILDRARSAGLARVHPIGSISVDLKGKEMAPLSELAKAGCVAFSDDGEPVYDSGLMRRALEWASMLGLPLSCHEEDKCLSAGGCMNESPLGTRLGLKGMPKVAEEVMIARDIELARTTKAKVHFCHVSSGRGVELIRRAKSDGIPVTAEVTPHHLILTEEAILEYDTNAKMSPPLREEEERLALLDGLRDGSIDCIASDHAPHEADSKDKEFDLASFGILGLQTSLSLLLEFCEQGILSPQRIIEALSSSPAKIFQLGLGRLQKGDPADICIIDPQHRWKFEKKHIVSLSTNSPFIGREMQGRADTVLVAGKILLRAGEMLS